MDEGQNLNNGGSGLGAAGGFDAFQNTGVGGGDIIITSGDNDGGQKSRNRLLVGVLAIVIVFALVAVGVFAMWKGGVFGGGGTISNKDTLTLFKRYADYLTENESMDFKDESLNNLEKYYNDFVNSTKLDLSEYSYDFSLFVTFLRHSLPLPSEVFREYYNNGEQSAREYLAEITANYVNFRDVYDIDYYVLVNEWADNVLRLAMAYNVNGCLNTSGIDLSCVVVAYNEKYAELADDVALVDSKILMVQDGIKKDLVSELDLIESALEGGKDVS